MQEKESKRDSEAQGDGSPNIRRQDDDSKDGRLNTMVSPSRKAELDRSKEVDVKKVAGSGAGMKAMATEGMNPNEVSKNVLLKCNVIRKKKDTVSLLHQGDGHLVSSPEKSLRQVYSEVFKRPVNTEYYSP
mmetsp:Transcript_4889/g.4083  ORF Transcript_4889/g.4083 Transcript_4889/m.4083 type:complete len:131 (+) Transcript_4889:140-532(+)